MLDRIFRWVGGYDWLYETGDRTEDGAVVIGHSYATWITNDYGERLEHFHRFGDADSAIRFEERVRAHIDAGGEINRDHWYEIDPAYGSNAYGALVAIGRDPLMEWEAARRNEGLDC